MGIGTGTAALIGGVVSAGAGIGGAAISANAAGNAADKQSAAAMNAAQLQYQASQNALGFQEQQYNQQQANLAPWLSSGAGALGNLDYLLGIGPQSTQGTMSGGAYSQPYSGQPGGTMDGAPTGGNAGGPAYPPATGGPAQFPGARPMGVQGQMGNAYDATGGQPSPGQPGGMQGSAPATNGMNPQTGQPLPGVGGSGQGGAFPPTRPMSAGAVGVQAPGGMNSIGSQLGTGQGIPPPTGSTNIGQAVNPSLGAYGSLMAPYGQQFTAPTALTEQNDPGYQARLNLGSQALQQSAAARGNLLTGGVAQGLNQYAQDYASNEYGNVYNRAYNTYASNYNQYQQQQTNEYNRLASLAGVGQQTAGQLGTLGQNAANSISSNLLGTAQGIGQQYNNAAAANASGIVGGANAWSGALGQSGNNIQNLLLLNQLYGGGGGSGSNPLGNVSFGDYSGAAG